MFWRIRARELADALSCTILGEPQYDWSIVNIREHCFVIGLCSCVCRSECSGCQHDDSAATMWAVEGEKDCRLNAH
jgi:hypothetical protein